MRKFKKGLVLTIALAIASLTTQSRLEAVTYVTDTGGYAYDESRAATNLAPAIALSTVALAAVIAIAVQNTHDASSSSSHFFHGFSSSSSSSSSSSHFSSSSS